ncbi:protein lin-10-like isoform X2 [Ornithodoros turicata]|uniref:protein lin-10-like isoform X2 n=1 Tax=Ornithodoros turicata TaxID=34597 RepID=UPI003138984F
MQAAASSEASSDTDEIARLFPKCRSRPDDDDSLNNNNSSSNGGPAPMEDSSVVSAYEAASRIEIAGGREIFSKSRSRCKRPPRRDLLDWDGSEPLVYEAATECEAASSEVVYDDIDAAATPAAARLLGSLPIAQYEGSPRRYGPRPGFPQRVPECKDFSDLEYRLYERVSGSAYVGQRLAGGTPSPSLDDGGGSVAGTETGEPMDLAGRQLSALSADTTDCESAASEALSLAGSLMGDSGALPAMPVLEDGLSSGRCSDAEDGSPAVVAHAIREIKQAIQHSKRLTLKNPPAGGDAGRRDPVWVPRDEEESALPPPPPSGINDEDCDTDQETDRLLGAQRADDRGFFDEKQQGSGAPAGTAGSRKKNNTTSKEVLIEGVLFRARYLGSTQLVCEGQPTKATRMIQAEEAVSRIKAPEGEVQPSTEVDLFISTEKIMVLNTDLKEIMMDHALRSISYIADIGDLVVLMARRRNMEEDGGKLRRTPKMICHVFESDEAQFIAQSIGQAFQVAYLEFLKANGIEDSSFVREMDYQEVLNSQEIFGDELEMFAKKERQKEVVVPKQKGEILGLVIVESGWGSMLPTVVVANLAGAGPAARCSQLNIGDQIIAINGVSLVGLPLATCQAYVKNTKHQSVVKLTVVPCAPVVEVKIKRPDTKYQLGFSVQNGVICSLLRGGIAERGGVRVGHRIIEINGQSVVAVPHEKIVGLLATSVGEIHMKTMPTSMFRLLTGQETPLYI